MHKNCYSITRCLNQPIPIQCATCLQSFSLSLTTLCFLFQLIYLFLGCNYLLLIYFVCYLTSIWIFCFFICSFNLACLFFLILFLFLFYDTFLFFVWIWLYVVKWMYVCIGWSSSLWFNKYLQVELSSFQIVWSLERYCLLRCCYNILYRLLFLFSISLKGLVL